MISLELSSKDLGRIYQVDLMVSKYYNMSVYQFILRYKYDSLFIDIIKKVTEDYNYNKSSMIEIELDDSLEDRYYQVEEKFSYGVDNRKVVERIISLGVNWVVEDVIVHKSSSVFILTGCDSERNLLAEPVNNTPDIRYVGKGESFYVEICSDFTKFMEKNRRYDLRKLKYLKLEDLLFINKMKTLLLFIDVVNKKYFSTWFVSRDLSCMDKYLRNTVAFEFDNMVVFKDLKDLFEYCKSCQADPSLYSSFNVEVKEERKKKNIEQIEDWEDDNYWESLFLSEPEYVKHSNITEEEWLSMAAFNDYEEDDFEKTYNEKDLTEEELEKIDFEVNFVEEPPEEEKYEAVSDKEFFDAFGGNPFLDDSSPF